MRPGTIAEGRIAAAPVDGRVSVTIAGFDANQTFNGCRYMPRGTDEPAADDWCLVAFDDLAAATVIAWDPS